MLELVPTQRKFPLEMNRRETLWKAKGRAGLRSDFVAQPGLGLR